MPYRQGKTGDRKGALFMQRKKPQKRPLSKRR